MSTSGLSVEVVGAAPCRMPDRILTPFHVHYGLRTIFFVPDPLRMLIRPASLLLPAQMLSQTVNLYPPPITLSSILPLTRPKSGYLTRSTPTLSSAPHWRWRR